MERTTHQKQTILNVLKSLRDQHPTAEMVYQSAVKDIQSISRTTVYRILNQFAAKGSIIQLHIPESGDRYDDMLSPHYHLLCNVCKRVINLTVPQFENVPLPQDDVCGCRITSVEITFRGICSECSAKQ